MASMLRQTIGANNYQHRSRNHCDAIASSTLLPIFLYKDVYVLRELKFPSHNSMEHSCHSSDMYEYPYTLMRKMISRQLGPGLTQTCSQTDQHWKLKTAYRFCRSKMLLLAETGSIDRVKHLLPTQCTNIREPRQRYLLLQASLDTRREIAVF